MSDPTTPAPLEAGDLIATYPCGCCAMWVAAAAAAEPRGRAKLHRDAGKNGWAVAVAKGGEPFPRMGGCDPATCGYLNRMAKSKKNVSTPDGDPT